MEKNVSCFSPLQSISVTRLEYDWCILASLMVADINVC